MLLDAGLDVAFLDGRGRFRGRLAAARTPHGFDRLWQYRFVETRRCRLMLAKSMIAGKIANHRRLLIARRRSRGVAAVESSIRRLAALADRAPRARDVDTLRGIEGMAARLSFTALGAAIRSPLITFERRTRRPPEDPFNAMLSAGYSLLRVRCEGAIELAGLDPYLGCLHGLSRRAPSLALDLMEELRPWIDRLVLNLTNTQRLEPELFEERVVDGVPGVFLTRPGWTLLLTEWDAALAHRSAHPDPRRGEWPLSGLILEQGRQLRHIFEGMGTAAYQPLELT